MAGKKNNPKDNLDRVTKKQLQAKMYILNDISPEEFAKAMGKYNYAKSPK